MQLKELKGKMNILKESGYLTFLSGLFCIIIMPIHVQYLPPFMVLWGLCWLIENYPSFENFKNIRKEYRFLFILFVLFFIWQSVSIIYSANLKLGFQNIFGRLSMILFPLVLIVPGRMIKQRIQNLNRYFAISISIYILFCFCYALIRSVTIHDGIWDFNPHPEGFPWLNHFYSDELTISQHPSYISMYVLLSAFFCFEEWFKTSSGYGWRYFWLILGVIFIVAQYFLSSRAGILITLLLVPFFFIRKWKRIGKNKYAWIGILLVMIILIPVVSKNQRVDYLIGKILNRDADYERKDDPRLLIWKTAFKIANENILLGVGIGDVRDELAAEYKRIGQESMARDRLNAHNQFLEVYLENGIIGLLMFLTIFGSMFYIAFKENNLVYGIFVIMMMSFFMFETVLYRLAGVSFFSLFSFLLLYYKPHRQED